MTSVDDVGHKVPLVAARALVLSAWLHAQPPFTPDMHTLAKGWL